jgi:hypothetical protein
VIEKLNRRARRGAGLMPNRNGINAAGDEANHWMRLKRTPMMRMSTGPFYAVVVWRGQTGAELCGLFFDLIRHFKIVLASLVGKDNRPRGDKMPPTFHASCPRGGANGERSLGNILPSIAGGSSLLFAANIGRRIRASLGRKRGGTTKRTGQDRHRRHVAPRAASGGRQRRPGCGYPRSTLVVRP